MKALFKASAIGAVATIATLSAINQNTANACSPDPYIGSVCITAAKFCPRGYHNAWGGTVQISEDSTLYSLLGDTYGGNGRTYFNLPDLRASEIIHVGRGPGLEDYRLGERSGWSSGTIPAIYWPEHSHKIDLSDVRANATIHASTAPANSLSPSATNFADTTKTAPNYAQTADTYTSSATVTATATASKSNAPTGAAGSGMGATHPPGPQLGMMVCIAYEGAYPPRS